MEIHLDAVGGVAGDMFAAALLDAFPEHRERALADAQAVLPAGVAVTVEEVRADSIRALSLRVVKAEHAGHVSYADMVARIEAADLAPGTAEHALAILALLAGAEARIHQVDIEKVHFHEIADWDTLADTVVAGSIAAALPDARYTVSALPIGGGTVQTQHGVLPVPAPATAALLEGFEWRDDQVTGERVTPTGAAILKHLAVPGARTAGGTLERVGCGAGTKRFAGVPNVLRVLVFDNQGASAIPDRVWDYGVGADGVRFVCVIEFDVDDMTGEEIGTAAELLRGTAGVRDVSLGQRIGKKGRPAVEFRLLADVALADSVAAACFAQTSTIGLRLRTDERRELPRAHFTVDGVRVKSVTRPGGVVTSKVESDDRSGATLAERRAR
ncbi:MAG: LarC family nickel insertion protein [Propionibacteriaceae bacterium]|nr:LarC family nickel insertion protein [Propionibacteriaceae bacterium]